MLMYFSTLAKFSGGLRYVICTFVLLPTSLIIGAIVRRISSMERSICCCNFSDCWLPRLAQCYGCVAVMLGSYGVLFVTDGLDL